MCRGCFAQVGSGARDDASRTRPKTLSARTVQCCAPFAIILLTGHATAFVAGTASNPAIAPSHSRYCGVRLCADGAAGADDAADELDKGRDLRPRQQSLRLAVTAKVAALARTDAMLKERES